MVTEDSEDREGARATPKPRIPPDKPLDASMAKTEIARALMLLYNLTHRLLHVDVRFTIKDFSEEADGLYDAIQSHAPLRIILRLASPLAAVGALWEKIEFTMEQVKAAKAEKEREKAAKVKGNGEASPVAGEADAKRVGKAPFK